MGKRKRSSVAPAAESVPSPPIVPVDITSLAKPIIRPAALGRRTSSRKPTHPPPVSINANRDKTFSIIDSEAALGASPDAEGQDENIRVPRSGKTKTKSSAPLTPVHKKEETSVDSSLSELSDVEEPQDASQISILPTTQGKPKTNIEGTVQEDPEAGGDEEAVDPEELREALSRPPPVNSPYLPLPWKGRLGYACLNTYLRSANPPVFSSRTCRIASILEHRHPLKDPTQPEHATKNRPDKGQPADVSRGQAYVEALGLANTRDIPKMLRWNDKYGIKFLRLSSEMFPFASHDVYGYKLTPFASEALAEAGRVAGELGHRLTTHPGQFTQLGSPRAEVIKASIRDLEYHCELLDLLKLPPQQDRDAVMILHMGGVFGDKAATLDRFRENYQNLSQKIKNRLVLENDDMCYSVHDLLPICEELNIPLVLDFHHHNIIFDSDKIREGTLDIMNLYDRIKATWTRKGITQKMHYSEPTPSAITARQRRKHNPRVATMPPCAPDMDLMIEAKDKEQACFELMRTFKLPGWDRFADVVPHTRTDENRPWKPLKKKTLKKKKDAIAVEDEAAEEADPRPPPLIPDSEVPMGGSEGRVYWPPGMEEWLRPKKREVKPRDPAKAVTLAEKAAKKRAEKAAWQAAREASADVGNAKVEGDEGAEAPSVYEKAKEATGKNKPARAPKSATAKAVARPMLNGVGAARRGVPTPSTSDFGDYFEDDDEDLSIPDLTDREEEVAVARKVVQAAGRPAAGSRRQNGRAAKKAKVMYADVTRMNE